MENVKRDKMRVEMEAERHALEKVGYIVIKQTSVKYRGCLNI